MAIKFKIVEVYHETWPDGRNYRLIVVASGDHYSETLQARGKTIEEALEEAEVWWIASRLAKEE
jgi:hypothetical protein